MSWEDILKLEDQEKLERDKLAEELVNNVHFFNPDIDIDIIVRRFSNNNSKLKPLVRSLEFMRPIKDDIELSVTNARSVRASYSFEVYGIKCRISYRLRVLGYISDDNFIDVEGKSVCVKATRDMTNGDFLTTLVYAVKNNAIPDIVKFVAYSSSKGHKNSVGSYVFDSSEEEYKKDFLIQLYKEWEESYLFDDNGEINIDLISEDFNLNDVNFWLAQFEVPKDILGRW